MWMMLYVTVFIFMFFSGSPFTGMLMLFMLSISLSLVLGMKNSWLLMVLVLVYVGGIMIMFTYMTSVLSYSKISSISLPMGVVSALFLLIFISGLLTGPILSISLWPATSFLSETLPFLVFLVIYMLVTLVSVFMIISKEDGPMQMK